MPYKYTLTAAAAVILILYLIYRFGRRRGEDDASIEQVPLPVDPGGGVSLTTGQATQVRATASKLWEELDSAGIWGRDTQPFQDYLVLSDTLFVAVYNDYNNLFGAMDQRTLRQKMEDENLFWAGVRVKPLFAAIYDRMDKFNLI